jgi:hypothetical protein
VAIRQMNEQAWLQGRRRWPFGFLGKGHAVKDKSSWFVSPCTDMHFGFGSSPRKHMDMLWVGVYEYCRVGLGENTNNQFFLI